MEYGVPFPRPILLPACGCSRPAAKPPSSQRHSNDNISACVVPFFHLHHRFLPSWRRQDDILHAWLPLRVWMRDNDIVMGLPHLHVLTLSTRPNSLHPKPVGRLPISLRLLRSLTLEQVCDVSVCRSMSLMGMVALAGSFVPSRGQLDEGDKWYRDDWSALSHLCKRPM